MSPRQVHHVKTWQQYFRQVRLGTKTAEVRFNDRDYHAGDILHQQEFNPTNKEFTGADLYQDILTVIPADQAIGLEEGYALLSLSFPRNTETEQPALVKGATPGLEVNCLASIHDEVERLTVDHPGFDPGTAAAMARIEMLTDYGIKYLTQWQACVAQGKQPRMWHETLKGGR